MLDNISLAFEPQEDEVHIKIYANPDMDTDEDILVKELDVKLPKGVWNCIIEID